MPAMTPPPRLSPTLANLLPFLLLLLLTTPQFATAKEVLPVKCRQNLDCKPERGASCPASAIPYCRSPMLQCACRERRPAAIGAAGGAAGELPGLGEQGCFEKDKMDPKSTYSGAIAVNATDLLVDAAAFCRQVSGSSSPRARPGLVVQGNGIGRFSEQHFRVRWVDGCRYLSGRQERSFAEPLGPDIDSPQERDGDEDRCTRLLAGNWDKCKDRKNGGVGGYRLAGCIQYITGPGHPF